MLQHENHQGRKKGLRLILVTDRCLSCAWVYFCSPLDPDIAPVSTKSAIPPIFFFKEWKKFVDFFFFSYLKHKQLIWGETIKGKMENSGCKKET